MYTSIFKNIFAVLLFYIGLTGCKLGSDKADKDKQPRFEDGDPNLFAPNQFSAEAIENARIDWKRFNHESDSMLNQLETKVRELDWRSTKASKKDKPKFKADVDSLKLLLKFEKESISFKNSEFSVKINTLNDSVAAENEAYKRSFKRELQELEMKVSHVFTNHIQ
jgi:hypothetical protein